jgi:hypothetical protein
LIQIDGKTPAPLWLKRDGAVALVWIKKSPLPEHFKSSLLGVNQYCQ